MKDEAKMQDEARMQAEVYSQDATQVSQKFYQSRDSKSERDERRAASSGGADATPENLVQLAMLFALLV